MNAGTPDDEAMREIKRRRAIILVVAVVVGVALFWGGGLVIKRSKTPSKGNVVGCYQGGETIVRLSREGFLHTPDGNWPYTVGKGDPLTLVVDEVSFAAEGPGVKFTRGPRGQGIHAPISRAKGFSLGEVAFKRTACKGMERRKS